MFDSKTKGIDKFISETLINKVSLYYNFCLRKSFKELFLFSVRKTTPLVCRSRSRFASAKVGIFSKPAKETTKKEHKKTTILVKIKLAVIIYLFNNIYYRA